MTKSATKHGRINEVLQDYWQGLLGQRSMPLESEVVIDVIKPIWDYCFLVSVHGEKFSYSYLGPKLIEAFGDDFTGREITESILYPHPEQLFQAFKQVVQYGQPQTIEDEFFNSRGDLVKYRSCILPLAEADGRSVGFLLGGMKWKIF